MAGTFAERVERNPWISHEYRRVKAEVERTGDDSLVRGDFQRRFKRDEADRYRRFKGQR